MSTNKNTRVKNSNQFADTSIKEATETFQDNKTVLLVLGKTCVGKTWFVDALGKLPEVSKQLQYTDRPIRDGEKDGETYHFIKPDTKSKCTYSPDVRTFDSNFGKVHYWSDFSKFANGLNVIAGDPHMYGYYFQEFRDQLYIIYLIQSDGVRLSRYLERKDGQAEIKKYNEIIRRFRADDKDHCEFFEIYPEAKTIFIVGNISEDGSNDFIGISDIIIAIKGITEGFKGSYLFDNGAIIQSTDTKISEDYIYTPRFAINTNTGNFNIREDK